MESKAKFLGHSIHQMLVAFPVGLLVASVAFDVLGQVFSSPSFAAAAYWMLTAGIVGGLLAVPFGIIDLMAIPDRTRASRIGMAHGVGNVVVLSLFITSWVLRGDEAEPLSVLAGLLSMTGAVLVLMTAWMGGELISRLGVSVSPHAHPNAESSLLGPTEGPVPDPARVQADVAVRQARF